MNRSDSNSNEVLQAGIDKLGTSSEESYTLIQSLHEAQEFVAPVISENGGKGDKCSSKVVRSLRSCFLLWSQEAGPFSPTEDGDYSLLKVKQRSLD